MFFVCLDNGGTDAGRSQSHHINFNFGKIYDQYDGIGFIIFSTFFHGEKISFFFVKFYSLGPVQSRIIGASFNKKLTSYFVFCFAFCLL
jgi:hypothetical protein